MFTWARPAMARAVSSRLNHFTCTVVFRIVAGEPLHEIINDNARVPEGIPSNRRNVVVSSVGIIDMG